MKRLLRKILPSRAPEVFPIECGKHYWLKRKTKDGFYYWCWICGRIAQ